MSLERINEVLRGAVGELSEAAKEIGWEFDLTQFSSPKVWTKLMTSVGAKGGKKKVLKYNLPSGHEIKRNIWLWRAPGLRIETNADPITGEKAMGGSNEPGYASYIYLEGDATKVKKLAAQISKKADYIKSDRKGTSMGTRVERNKRTK